MKLTLTEIHYIEKAARSFSQSGNTITEGKIIAYLLICESGLLSFEQIMESLKLSKGNTSQSIHSLLNKGLIEKAIVPFERKSFYQLINPNEIALLENRIQAILNTQNIFIEAQSINKQFKRKKQQTVIKDIIEFNHFMYEELQKIKLKWSKR